MRWSKHLDISPGEMGEPGWGGIFEGTEAGSTQKKMRDLSDHDIVCQTLLTNKGADTCPLKVDDAGHMRKASCCPAGP